MNPAPMVPPERDLPPNAAAAIKEMLVINATTLRQTGRRVRTVAVLTAGLMVVGAAAGAYALFGQPQEQFTNVGCYAATSLGADTAVIPSTTDDPVAACAALWESGTVKGGTTTAPALVACVLPSKGAIGVFPSSDACEELNLTALGDVQVEPGAPSVVALRDSLIDQLRDCKSGQEARAIIESELRERGFSGWTVRTRAGSQCATLGFNVADKEIDLHVASPTP